MTGSRDIDCVICGTCVADILVHPVPLAKPVGGGRLFQVDPIEVVTGGIVCNTGIAMRRLGMRVAAASLVGADAWADVVRTQLSAEGIDTTALEVDPTQATSTTAVLVDPGGERSFAHHVGAPQTLGLDFMQRHAALFARSRVALVGYVGLLPALEPVLAGALADLAPALPHVDVYVPSRDEAAQQTGLTDPRAIIDCYRGHGAAGIVGVKLGVEGTLLSPAPGAFVEIPCVPAPGSVVDTTGAGDSLLAGLLTGIIRGMPLEEAGLLGAATAACCVTGLGAVAGLRSLEETWKLACGVLNR